MIPTIRPTLKQHLAWKKLLDKTTQFLLFGGAAGGGKSWLGCEWLLVMCLMYPETRYFIGRKELKRLKDSTLITFFKVCSYHKIPKNLWRYHGQDHYIIFSNGSRIDLLDLAYLPSDPLYERYGSIEYTSGWIEEAGEVVHEAFDTLKSRIGRQKNKEYGLLSKVLLTANPKKNWLYTYIYKPFKEGALDHKWHFIQSLYTDNPYLDSLYEDNLNGIKNEIKKQRLKNGDWEYSDEPGQLFSFEDINYLFVNNNVDTNGRYITCDVARDGSDKAIIVLWHGFRIVKWWIAFKCKTPDIVNKIKQIEKSCGVPRHNTVIDEDGVGGGVVDYLPRCTGFINNSSPIVTKENEDPEVRKPPNYQNLKTQVYFKFSQVAEEQGIHILVDKIEIFGHNKQEFSPEMLQAQIIEELEMIKQVDIDSDSKLKLMKKEDIKAELGRSPDFADVIMLRFIHEIKKGKPRITTRKTI